MSFPSIERSRTEYKNKRFIFVLTSIIYQTVVTDNLQGKEGELLKSTSYNIKEGEIEAGEPSNTNSLIYFILYLLT